MEAQIGGEQGEWTWVSYRGRKVLGLEKSGRNEQWQGNRYGGSGTSRDSGFERYGDDRMGSRSRNRERWRTEFPRFRVLHEYGQGRSMTHYCNKIRLANITLKVGEIVRTKICLTYVTLRARLVHMIRR